jgi:hypothetical protein
MIKLPVLPNCYDSVLHNHLSGVSKLKLCEIDSDIIPF